MNQNVENIVVIGGGTAGWLTALLARNYYPQMKITLIESKEIGILGAGEGSTPYILNILNQLNIPIKDLIIHADATIKNGIRFINWNGDDKEYFHNFSLISELNNINNFNVLIEQLSRSDDIDDINFSSKLSRDGLVPYLFGKQNTYLGQNSIDQLISLGNHSLHFNANKLAKFLSELASKRNINHIEGKVTQIKNDEDGYITSLKIDTLRDEIPVDFVFDCSGFARLVIGKHYKTKWKSYSDVLPLDSAIPFFIEHDNDIQTETKAIAMKAGWVWQIPVTGRYGCGYVYDSNFINADQALDEAQNLFNRKLTVPKNFKFKAGTYEKTLVKNCLAVGLSQSFVEPLEATSIWIALVNLDKFLNHNAIFRRSQVFEDKFNLGCLQRNDDVKEFLYLHYITKRQDSEFWKTFSHSSPMYKEIKEKIELLSQYQSIDYMIGESKMFAPSSWIQVSAGLGLFDREKYLELYSMVDVKFSADLHAFVMKKHERYLNTCLSHKNFVDILTT